MLKKVAAVKKKKNVVRISHTAEFASECWVNITVKTDTTANKTFSWNAQTNNTRAEK